MTDSKRAQPSALTAAELTTDQLDIAVGGTQHAVRSPRDAASGLATGRRTY